MLPVFVINELDLTVVDISVKHFDKQNIYTK